VISHWWINPAKRFILIHTTALHLLPIGSSSIKCVGANLQERNDVNNEIESDAPDCLMSHERSRHVGGHADRRLGNEKVFVSENTSYFRFTATLLFFETVNHLFGSNKRIRRKKDAGNVRIRP